MECEWHVHFYRVKYRWRERKIPTKGVGTSSPNIDKYRQVSSSVINCRYLSNGHSILDQECNTGIKVAHISFEHKVLFGLGRNLGLEFPEALLGWISGVDE